MDLLKMPLAGKYTFFQSKNELGTKVNKKDSHHIFSFRIQLELKKGNLYLSVVDVLTEAFSFK